MEHDLHRSKYMAISPLKRFVKSSLLVTELKMLTRLHRSYIFAVFYSFIDTAYKMSFIRSREDKPSFYNRAKDQTINTLLNAERFKLLLVTHYKTFLVGLFLYLLVKLGLTVFLCSKVASLDKVISKMRPLLRIVSVFNLIDILFLGIPLMLCWVQALRETQAAYIMLGFISLIFMVVVFLIDLLFSFDFKFKRENYFRGGSDPYWIILFAGRFVVVGVSLLAGTSTKSQLALFGNLLHMLYALTLMVVQLTTWNYFFYRALGVILLSLNAMYTWEAFMVVCFNGSRSYCSFC